MKQFLFIVTSYWILTNYRVKIVRTYLWIVFLLLVGCDQFERPSQTSFEKFHQCVESFNAYDPEINLVVREACLQKHEKLVEHFSGRNVTAKFIDRGVLEIEYTNPYNYLITNIEIAFIHSVNNKDCRNFKFTYEELARALENAEQSDAVNDAKRISELIDKSEYCFTSYASGRTWILPNMTGTAKIVPKGGYNTITESGNSSWLFKIQSVRYLELANLEHKQAHLEDE